MNRPRISLVFLITFLIGSAIFSLARIADASTTVGDPITVFVQLEDEPTVAVFVSSKMRMSNAMATMQAQAQLYRIDQLQISLLAQAPLAEAQVIYRVQRSSNGIAIRVDPAQLKAIESLPGVVAVHPLPIYTVERRYSASQIGAPTLWEQLYGEGLAGDTISIGIVDTGIDYLHTDFGGPGLGYDRNDPTRIDDGVSFPTAKVVGGYDFAGDGYNANSSENSVPQPDQDPMDCWGHGTHVSGIAGGYGTLTNGDTYTGEYHAGMDFSAFDIAPGMAPKADLYALKVFGCTGGSQLISQAIEWAVDPNQDGDFSDRLDVLNLSLGSSFGGQDDPSTVALNNAALAGILVVAAAGNSGDTYYIVASPSVADRAISVAASSGRQIAPFSSRGPRRGDSALKPDITAPGTNIVSASARTGRGKVASSGTSMATPYVAGTVALLRQVHPSWTVEEIKALLLNNALYDLMGSDEYPPNRYGGGRSGAGHLDLTAIYQTDFIMYNAENPGHVSVSMGAPAVVSQMHALKNVRVANKSAVTRTFYLTYTPVVDLPGATFTILGGLDYSLSPHATLNVPVLFSADAQELRNQADPTVALRSYFPRHYLSEEFGFLYAWPTPAPFSAALVPESSTPNQGATVEGDAYFQLDPATGTLAYSVSITSSRSISVSAADLRYISGDVKGPILHSLTSSQVNTDIEGLTITGTIVLDAEQMTMLAGGLIALDVKQDGDAIVFQGLLTAQEVILRLPLYAAPRPAAAMHIDANAFDFGFAAQGVRTASLLGQGIVPNGGVEQSAFPTDTVSLVTVLELQWRDPKSTSLGFSSEDADLQYVGVAVVPSQEPTNLPPTAMAQRRILFGVATYEEWTTPSEIAIQIYFDTDEDGNIDYTLRTTSLGTFLGGGATDEFVTVLEDRKRQTEKITHFVNLISAAELNTALFNNNVMLMAVDVADLGLTKANSDFDYLVSSRNLGVDETRSVLDLTRPLHYDVFKPGLWVDLSERGELPTFYDLPTTELSVGFDRHAFTANRSRGLLLLHHHNAPGNRAEVVEIRSAWPAYLPKIDNNGAVHLLN